MSTTRFAFICTVLVVVLFSLSALSIGLVVLAMLAGLVAILKDHAQLYFSDVRLGLFNLVAYLFAVVMMVWTTLSLIPGIDRVIPSGLHPPDPFPHDYWPHFALGVLFLVWGLRPSNPNAEPMPFLGSVFTAQVTLLKQTPKVMLASLKRSVAFITEAHWLKGLAGLVLLILSVPVSLVAMTTGALAVCWLAVLWAGMSLLLVAPLWLLYKAIFPKGVRRVCRSCGREQHMSGPGPMGLFFVRCICGRHISMWKRDGTISGKVAPTILPWSKRKRQAGTQPLLILGALVVLLMALRAFGICEGSPRRALWGRDRGTTETRTGNQAHA